MTVNHTARQWGEEGIQKNSLTLPLWLQTAQWLGDVESARLVRGPLAPRLTPPPPSADPPPQLPAVSSHAHLQAVLFPCDSLAAARPQAPALLSAWCPSLWEEKSGTGTCWVEQSCSVTGLMHHKGPRRTARTRSRLPGIRLVLTNKKGQAGKIQSGGKVGNSLAWRCFCLKKFWALGEGMQRRMKRVWSSTRFQMRFSHFWH